MPCCVVILQFLTKRRTAEGLRQQCGDTAGTMRKDCGEQCGDTAGTVRKDCSNRDTAGTMRKDCGGDAETVRKDYGVVTMQKYCGNNAERLQRCCGNGAERLWDWE